MSGEQLSSPAFLCIPSTCSTSPGPGGWDLLPSSRERRSFCFLKLLQYGRKLLVGRYCSGVSQPAQHWEPSGGDVDSHLSGCSICSAPWSSWGTLKAWSSTPGAVCCEGTHQLQDESSSKLQKSPEVDCPLDVGLQTVDTGFPAKQCWALPACFCVTNRWFLRLTCSVCSSVQGARGSCCPQGWRSERCTSGSCVLLGSEPIQTCPLAERCARLARAALLVPASPPGPAPCLC